MDVHLYLLTKEYQPDLYHPILRSWSEGLESRNQLVSTSLLCGHRGGVGGGAPCPQRVDRQEEARREQTSQCGLWCEGEAGEEGSEEPQPSFLRRLDGLNDAEYQ